MVACGARFRPLTPRATEATVWTRCHPELVIDLLYVADLLAVDIRCFGVLLRFLARRYEDGFGYNSQFYVSGALSPATRCSASTSAGEISLA